MRIYLLVSFICFLFTNISAQNQHFPQVPFNVDALEIRVIPDLKTRTLRVESTYSLTSLYDSLSTLTLQATRLSVDAITYRGKALSYTEQNDTLYVETGILAKGTSAKIVLKTSAKPGFGFHWTSDTTLFTNSITAAATHWFPVLLSPKMHAPVTTLFDLPNGLVGVGAGNKMAPNSWKTDQSVYLPEVGFAIAHFNENNQKVGVRQINVFSKSNETKSLITKSYSYLNSIETKIGREFPFQSVNLVLLPDLRWSPSPVHVNSLFLDDEAWLGWGMDFMISKSHYFEYSQLQLWQAAMIHSADTLPLSQYFNNATVFDSLLNVEENLRLSSDDEKIAFSMLKSAGFESNLYSQSHQSMLENWYQKSGWIPAFSTKKRLVFPPDTIFADVDLLNKRVQISLPMLDKERTLALWEIGFRDTIKTELKLTKDKPFAETLLKRSPRNVLIFSDHITDVIVSKKPESMWIWQLKNNQDEHFQIKAVENLAQFRENPDLQLALADQYSKLEENSLKAAYVETLGEILQGATGTHTQFINASNSKNDRIRNRAFFALRHYSGNEEVQFRLQSALRRDLSVENRRQALISLGSVMDSTSYKSFLQKNVLRSDYYPLATTFVDLLQSRMSADGFRNSILPLLQTNVPWEIRVHVAKIILSSENGFLDEIAALFTDEDPRVRFTAWSMMNVISSNKSLSSEMGKIMWNEYDERVLHIYPKNEHIGAE